MFVPKNFTPPSLAGQGYIARKLTARDVYLDYMAVMSSIDVIHKTRGGKWPQPDLTFEDDLIDLAWHQREFEFKTSFAYTVLNPEETECLGCIYFYPPSSDESSKDSYEADVSWWCTQKAYDAGLYSRISMDIKKWVESEWPFKEVYYSNMELPAGFSRK